MRKPRITVIGGGTGIPVILKSLRDKDVDITAIVTAADDGGSSGEIRQALQVTPPGDLRNVLLALSDMPKLYEQIFQYRFAESDGALAGHPLGNLLIAGISEMQGSTYNAMQLLTKFFHTTGKIYPSSDNALTLHAVFADGHEVAGESKIADYKGMIDHVYVTNSYNEDEPTASRKVVTAIMESDMIVLGETQAQVTYVCNIMTQRGETEFFSDADHVRVLNDHLHQRFIDTVLVNIEPVPKDYMDSNQFDEYLVQVKHDFPGLQAQADRVISSNFLRLEKGGAFHDGDLVVDELLKIIQVRS